MKAETFICSSEAIKCNMK